MPRRRDAIGGELPFAVVAAYLRLGKKYEITQLRTEALDILHYDFPSSLDEYDRNTTPRIDDFQPSTNVQVINLARETGTHVLLPAAFYGLCNYGLSIDDVLAIPDPTSLDSSSLSSEDQLLVVLGCHRLSDMKLKVTYAWMSNANTHAVSLHCLTPQSCTTAIKSAFFASTFSNHSKFDALTSWEHIPWYQFMCDPCTADARRQHDEGRVQVWDRLPCIFGLPEWPELLKE